MGIILHRPSGPFMLAVIMDLKYYSVMSDVTKILSKIEAGDQKASAELLPLVYDELRRLAAARMASERPDHTLQATALAHEAYVRLVDVDAAQNWDNRGHFYSAAAEAMRRILVESARRKRSLKRNPGGERVILDDNIEETLATRPDLALELNDALEQLAEEDEVSATLFKLRVFTGLSVTEAGKVLGVETTTAYKTWRFARSWLVAFVGESGS